MNVLNELYSVLEDKPQSRVFQIVAECAFDWMFRDVNSWTKIDDKGVATWLGPSEEQQNFLEKLLSVANDFDVATSIIYRINWTRESFLKQGNAFLSDDDLVVFLQADVHAFHGELRSLFDSLALAVKSVGGNNDQIPHRSFNKLREWCIKSTQKSNELLGDELTAAIVNTEWFLEFRDVRDKIIHHRNEAVVRLMSPENDIGFVTFVGAQKKKVYAGPDEFVRGDWVYFEPYAGYYVGRLLSLLNTVSEVAAARLKIDLNDVSWSTPRFSLTKVWIVRAIKALESGSQTNVKGTS
jgi:hypothetical protein